MAKDPVCGMEINEAEAGQKSEYKSETYYFCSAHCKENFDKEPEKFVGGNGHDAHEHHHH